MIQLIKFWKMIEKCGCKVIVDPKTQFETIEPCEKHNTMTRFTKAIKKVDVLNSLEKKGGE